MMQMVNGVHRECCCLLYTSKHYEVATYRKERYGADSHRPEEVIYADTLEEDVKRRDFTVNGMAMNRYKEVIDLVGGRRDIKHKVLRTIGNPTEQMCIRDRYNTSGNT